MSVIDTVSNFVNKHLPRSGRVIVGLSGGADSVVWRRIVISISEERKVIVITVFARSYADGWESNSSLGILMSLPVKPRLLNPLRWHVARCAMIGGED